MLRTMSQLTETTFNDLIVCVREVGDYVESLNRSFIKKENKSDGSLVTSSDYYVHEKLCEFLRNYCPLDGILSEEAPLIKGSTDGLWIMDPIDGTTYYAEGNPYYRIMLSRSERQKFTSGIIYFPAQKLLAHSQYSTGTFLNGVQSVVSQETQIKNDKIYLSQGVSEKLPFTAHKQFQDTGFSILKLISGEIDGMIIRITNHKIWDVTPFIALIEHAGGRVTNHLDQEIIIDPEEGIQFHGNEDKRILIASNSNIHPTLVEMVQCSL